MRKLLAITGSDGMVTISGGSGICTIRVLGTAPFRDVAHALNSEMGTTSWSISVREEVTCPH